MRRSGRLLAVLALLCVAALTAVGVLGWQRHTHDVVQQSRTDAVSAARVAAGDILGYDYRSIEETIKRARSDTTGAFRKEYDETAAELLPQSKQVKAIVQATVGSAAVMSADRDRVVVLLFVDQATVKQQPGAKTPTTRIDQSRVRMTMSRKDGHWLVSELVAL
ncbi:MAG: Mce-associated rane protein [Actinomycetota bacterium]|jgi:Mce-associated membrane protein|nr:Mce-associated rane protein [Actinomycetota bacterium]